MAVSRNRWSRSRIRAVAAAGCLSLAGGCYEYLPATPAEVQGRRVEVELTDVGTLLLTPTVGPQVETLGGTLVDQTSEAYTVSVLSIRNRYGIESDWRGERVTVPRSAIARLSKRSLSKPRTLIGSAVLMVALVTVRNAFVGPGGSNVPGNSPAGPPVSH